MMMMMLMTCSILERNFYKVNLVETKLNFSVCVILQLYTLSSLLLLLHYALREATLFLSKCARKL